MKIIGHIRHFRWLGPSIWWEISQIWIEYIKRIRQMSDEPWKFFSYTESTQPTLDSLPFIWCNHIRVSQGITPQWARLNKYMYTYNTALIWVWMRMESYNSLDWGSKLTTIGTDNGLSPGRRPAIIWTNAEILFIGPSKTKLQWNLNRNLYIFIQENAFKHVAWKMVAILTRPPLNVIISTSGSRDLSRLNSLRPSDTYMRR